jgi:hypothetical protein
VYALGSASPLPVGCRRAYPDWQRGKARSLDDAGARSVALAVYEVVGLPLPPQCETGSSKGRRTLTPRQRTSRLLRGLRPLGIPSASTNHRASDLATPHREITSPEAVVPPADTGLFPAETTAGATALPHGAGGSHMHVPILITAYVSPEEQARLRAAERSSFYRRLLAARDAAHTTAEASRLVPATQTARS